MLRNELQESNKLALINYILYIMKKFLFSLIFIFAIAFCGCAIFSKLTPDGMEKASSAVGVATGYVVNHTKMTDNTKTSINEVLFVVSTVVPEAGKSFVETWTPIAKEHTQIFVEKGKLTEEESSLVISAFEVICDGMDYIFGVKYSEVGNYMELVHSAIHGFCNGFTSVVVPSTVMQASNLEWDEEAYAYLMSMRNERTQKKFRKAHRGNRNRKTN